MISHTAKRTRKPLGLILYSGPSQLDDKPIVAIATGFRRRSANPKTGDMIQTWILRADMNPIEAIHSGADESICGRCPLRGFIQLPDNDLDRPVNRHRACYVSSRPIGSVFRALGRYERFELRTHLHLFEDRMLRLGSYGDPVAIPYGAWTPLLKVVCGWTGYTHQWRERRFWRYRRFLMASVESLADAQEAQRRGWRTFRTTPPGELPAEGEFSCPASAEQNHRLDCFRCGACNGSGNNPRRASVVIGAHGSPAVRSSYRRVIDKS